MTRGFSRKAVRLLVFKSSTRTWAELHERAFRRLGGAVRVVVLDNLKEGVLKPDPRIYQRVLARVGVAPEQAVFIDDFPRNIAGAEAAGLHGIHFRDPDQARAELLALLAARG